MQICEQRPQNEYLWCKYANKKTIFEHVGDHGRIIPYQALIEPSQKLLIILERRSQESLQLPPQSGYARQDITLSLQKTDCPCVCARHNMCWFEVMLGLMATIVEELPSTN